MLSCKRFKYYEVFTTFLAAAAILSSCNEKSRLADNITGSWSSQSERIETPGLPTTTTVTRMMTFTPGLNTSTGGEVQATALFSVESGTKVQAAGTQPIAVTVNGTATITGQWEAVDDDEIAISFDSRTLKVNIDPTDVVLDYDIATETAHSVTDSIAPDIAATVSRSMTAVMPQHVFNFTKIDDIKVTGNLMSCEIGKKDYTFHRDI